VTYIPPPSYEELAAECARLQHLEEGAEPALPPIREIRRWTIRPGDRLMVTLAQRLLSPAEAELVKSVVRRSLALPDDFPVLVISEGMDVQAIEEGGPDAG
jgi:hypothetical protein